jgi:hypothetical protein
MNRASKGDYRHPGYFFPFLFEDIPTHLLCSNDDHVFLYDKISLSTT